eukprot:jgi/Mesvir1/17657/Mv01357-RA.1
MFVLTRVAKRDKSADLSLPQTVADCHPSRLGTAADGTIGNHGDRTAAGGSVWATTPLNNPGSEQPTRGPTAAQGGNPLHGRPSCPVQLASPPLLGAAGGSVPAAASHPRRSQGESSTPWEGHQAPPTTQGGPATQGPSAEEGAPPSASS